MESVILSSPLLLIGYGLALILCCFDLFKRTTGYVFPFVSLAICIACTVYALLLGADLNEATTVILIFLIVNIITFGKDAAVKKVEKQDKIPSPEPEKTKPDTPDAPEQAAEPVPANQDRAEDADKGGNV